MQWIVVSDSGIDVRNEAEALVSMHGKQTRPAQAWSQVMPWTDIASITISAMTVPPDGERLLNLDIDLTWGEYVSVGQDARGFGEAVAAIAQKSGAAQPDLAQVGDEPVYLFQR